MEATSVSMTGSERNAAAWLSSQGAIARGPNTMISGSSFHKGCNWPSQ
jgi:hypothetical protein